VPGEQGEGARVAELHRVLLTGKGPPLREGQAAALGREHVRVACEVLLGGQCKRLAPQPRHRQPRLLRRIRLGLGLSRQASRLRCLSRQASRLRLGLYRRLCRRLGLSRCLSRLLAIGQEDTVFL
jgi:hypothetical protein